MENKNYDIFFKGDFKDLKKIGFTMTKWFEGNRIAYTWKLPDVLDNFIFIWKKGKFVDLLESCTGRLRIEAFTLIRDHKLIELISMSHFTDSTRINMVYDLEQKKFVTSDELLELEKNIESDNLPDFLKLFHKRFKDVCLYLNEIVKIKELIELDYIELREVDSSDK